MMAKYKKLVGQTPNGGAYAEIYYFDDSGNAADESEASKCVISEFTENGDLIAETWGVLR